MMIIGGFQYLTSAGDASKIGAAKSRMANALIGLVLVLGAYTILKTINPELLVMKPLVGVTSVSTKTTFMPWCDTVTADGSTVNPIWGEPGKCGSVGEYTNGQSRLACLYRSACPKKPADSNMPDILKVSKYHGAMDATCVQTLTTSAYTNDPFDSERVLAFVDQKSIESKGITAPDFGGDTPEYRQWLEEHRMPTGAPRPDSDISFAFELFATCATCTDYGPQQIAETSRVQVTHPGRCGYWQVTANDGALTEGAWDRQKQAGKTSLSLCRWMPDLKGCAQGDIECLEPTATSSCDNYNVIKPFFMKRVGSPYAFWAYGWEKAGRIDARPDALQDLCNANPCGYNPGKGCGGEGGVINGIRTVTTIVRDGIAGIQACENR